MPNTFEFIGKMTIGKESEKFKPYDVSTSPKGWTTKKLLFNVIAGNNRHMLESKGGFFADGNGKVYTFSKQTKDEKGNQIKGEKLEIPWKDRFNAQQVEKVAEFKKFVVDLEEPNRRYKLEKAAEGNLSESELAELNVTDISTELENSKKKRKEFIAEADFTEYLYKVITSGKFDNRVFRILGNIAYSEYKGKFYRKYEPTRVYLASTDASPLSEGQITVFYNRDCLDKSLLSKTKKLILGCYVREYDNSRKSEIGCPLTLIIDRSKDESNEQNAKINDFFEKQFTVKDKSWKELGVKVKLLEGAQRVEITPDMLDETQKELLELGAITLDDIIREMGDTPLYGDRIDEMVVINVARGYTKGRKDTLYSADDFVIQEVEIRQQTPAPDTKEEDEDDIFADLDI